MTLLVISIRVGSVEFESCWCLPLASPSRGIIDGGGPWPDSSHGNHGKSFNYNSMLYSYFILNKHFVTTLI